MKREWFEFRLLTAPGTGMVDLREIVLIMDLPSSDRTEVGLASGNGFTVRLEDGAEIRKRLLELARNDAIQSQTVPDRRALLVNRGADNA